MSAIHKASANARAPKPSLRAQTVWSLKGCSHLSTERDALSLSFIALSSSRVESTQHKNALAMAAVLSVVITGAAHAQTVPVAEVIVTAPLTGVRIESLQGAEVLRREEIVANLNGGLGDTLDAQPGVATTFFGAGASRPIIRGLGDDRVRVLQNGIGAIDASTASPDHAVTSDGLDAQRIEILRGAAALAYGGNAIGGVVNVIDQSIPTQRANGVHGSGLVGLSSVDNGVQGEVDLATDIGFATVRLGVSGRDTDAYDTPIGTATNSWTQLRSYSGGASVVRGWGFAGVAVRRTQNEYGLFPESLGAPGGRIEMQQTRIEARGDIRLNVGPFDRLDFGGQHSDYEHTEFEGGGAAGTRFTSRGWEGRVEAHHASGRLQGVIGFQASDVDFAARGNEAFITPTNTRDLGLFAVERWDTGRWGLEGGARVERRSIDNEGGGSRQFSGLSVSAGAFLRPRAGWFIGTTIASTERAPTQIELFAAGPHLATLNYELGDPSLGKERAISVEGSVRYQSDRFSFELNLFNVNFTNYIALVERGDVFWLDDATETSGFAPNASSPIIPPDSTILPVLNFISDDATFQGGEISASVRIAQTRGFTFRATAAMDIVQARFDSGGRPPRIPPRSTTLGLTADSENWSGRIEFVDTARQDRVATFETTTEGYSFVNANLAWRPMGRDGALTLRIDARNLTDELGRVHASFLKDDLPLPGRNIRFSVSSRF